MRVSELMQQPVLTVRLESSVKDAVVLLAEDHVSALPVTDASGRMVGVLSSSDIIMAEAEAEDEVAREALFAGTFVRDLMTARPITISPDADVKEAAQEMMYAEVHRIFVTEGEQVVGVISSSDIVRAVATGKL